MNTKPSHPGALLREIVMPEAGVTITEVARCCGVARNTLSKIVNERADISEDIAIRLSRSVGSTPRFWLEMQNRHNLWKLEQENRALYDRIPRVDAA